MVDCANSNRLWTRCLKAAKHYRETLEKQIAAIAKHDLAFLSFEPEIKSARRDFAISKIAVVNHHKIHRCSEV